MEDEIFFNQSKYIKEMLKKSGLEDSKPTKTPMSTEIKLTKDDEADFVDSFKYRGEITIYINQMDYKRTREYLPRIHRTRRMDEDLRESYRTLEKCHFHEGRFVTSSFIEVNNMLPSFQAVGLEPFLTLNEPICPRFVVEFYHSLEVKRDKEERPYIEFKLGQFTFKLTSSQLSRIFQTTYALETFYTSEWSLISLDDHPNSNFFSPKHDLVNNKITIPKTTQTQLQRSSNKLHIDDIRPDLRGWELFFRENFFCSLGKKNKVYACIVYMLYYLTLQRKFNLTSMILYRMEEVKIKRDGPMSFAMLLTCLYNHILQTNPQSVSPLASKEKGKRIPTPLVISSSSSSSDDNEAPSFLEFYDKLSDNEELTKTQREKRGMFKCLNCYFVTITKNLKKQK
ncbi:hypothetical protein Tco_0359275 [Tanacetum coccineum]